MKNAVNWFEIPVTDFKRVVGFYERIFEIRMFTEVMMGFDMGLFPSEQGVGGAVVHGKNSIPSDKGTLVYLNAGDELAVMLSRVESAG